MNKEVKKQRDGVRDREAADWLVSFMVMVVGDSTQLVITDNCIGLTE